MSTTYMRIAAVEIDGHGVVCAWNSADKSKLNAYRASFEIKDID